MTVYQVDKPLIITKDLVFGWTVMDPEGTVVLNSASAETLSAVQKLLPNTPLYEELREFIDTRLKALKAEKEKPKGKVISQPSKDEIAFQKERRAVQIRMEKSMLTWFSNLTPARVYEFKNQIDGYIYARVIPHSAGYVVIDDQMRVAGEFKGLSEVASFVLRRWW